jgi:hypothetical protein
MVDTHVMLPIDPSPNHGSVRNSLGNIGYEPSDIVQQIEMNEITEGKNQGIPGLPGKIFLHLSSSSGGDNE